ncbi:MAG: RNA polymerase factor sigma-54 [Puniceicoccales bacterium]|nr:RNA polymerase factor sigma-54 [Puniceicoccales bacterium]
MDFLLTQEQKQVQKLSAAMRQSLEILQMPVRDLGELIKKECAGNPTIEVVEWRDRAHTGRERSDIHSEFLENVAGEIPLHEHLLQQVPDWTDGRKKILLKLLEFVDERGFFDGNLGEIAETLHADPEEVEFVYEESKSLSPCGIGARNLREWLLLQLELRRGDAGAEIAKIIVRDNFDDLQVGKIDALCKKLKLPRAKVIEAGKLVARLNFSPISGFSNEKTTAMITDFRIFKSDGEWAIDCNSDFLDTVRFSSLYKEAMADNSSIDRKTLAYLRKRARDGRQLCNAIERRQSTLLEIAKVILARQLEFFEYGAKYMKPLRLKDVAAETKLHVSTISRAVRGKYVSTPHGTLPMAKFFDSGVQESISKGAIMERIRMIVNSRNGRPTDAKIAEILGQSGINVARRTVAKYRKMMRMPNSRALKVAGFSDRNDKIRETMPVDSLA